MPPVGAPRAALTRHDGGLIASRSRLMSQQQFVGLDVSVKETAICVVDPQGRVVHRAAIESHPAVIGAITALSVASAFDDAEGFKRSSSAGAYLGLTPRRYESDEVSWNGQSPTRRAGR